MSAYNLAKQLLRTVPIVFITRIELLSFPALTDAEAEATTTVLQAMQYLPLTSAVEDMTIHIRRQHNLKVPDAIIAATAKVHQLDLVTLDQQLAIRMINILGNDA